MPKRRRDTEILLALALALALASLNPRASLSEAELNDRLLEWLTAFTNPAIIGQFTLRRYMVDIFLLLRDPRGSVYRINQTLINRLIEPEAREAQPGLLMDQVAAERKKGLY